jgi:pentapeptide MXKDX repeat protein
VVAAISLLPFVAIVIQQISSVAKSAWLDGPAKSAASKTASRSSPSRQPRSLNMRKIWLGIAGAVVCLALVLAVVGRGLSTLRDNGTPEAGKMEGDKMHGDKMQGGKMEGDKMANGKMEGGKMEGGKMEGDKMSNGKMSGDKMESK